MYNDTIKAENKIISSDDLTQIFQLMGETLKKYLKVSQQEEMQNRMLDTPYQNYTFKDEGSKMKVTVDFYDNTNITFDNYDNFMGIFYSRIDEIKTMDIYYALNYTVMTPAPNRSRNFYTQSIQMHINENKLDITLNLKSADPKLDEIYNFIKNKILNAPEKYDEVIRNKNKIINTVSFGAGMIPGIVITSLLLFIPVVNNIILKGYVVYPIVAVILSYMIGSMISSSKLDKYYETIVPSKKYAGYDSTNYKRIYKDDIDSFVGTSEILIGKKINNLDNRRMIKKVYEKYKGLIPKELIALLIVTVIVIIIGLFI
jgi:hypothetical protein